MRKEPFRITEGMRSARPRRAAIAHAKSGVKVLAVWGISDGKCDCGVPHCKNAGKHPIPTLFPKGFKDATSDIAFIQKVWTLHPNANVAIVPDGDLGVLDCDGEIGLKTAASLHLPSTVTVLTGRGEHRYFIGFPSEPPKALPGIDIRAQANGYVCVPPSTHKSGKKYRFADATSELAPYPMKPAIKQGRISIDPGERSASAREGGRNNKLASIAGSLRNIGLTTNTIKLALLAINPAVCKPPLERDEVSKIARSIGNYPTPTDEAFGNMADVVAEEPKFLFGPYILQGAITILEGAPGQGKSSFCTALTAAVTTGKAVPWSEDIVQGPALIFSAEDDPARVQKPRLLAHGADVSLIRYQSDPFTLDEKGISTLRLEMENTRPRLVIIDPFTTYLVSEFLPPFCKRVFATLLGWA